MVCVPLVSEALGDGSWWGVGSGWCVVPEELSVAQGGSAGAIDSLHVLVVLADFDHNASFVPFERVGACLILDAHMVTNFQ